MSGQTLNEAAEWIDQAWGLLTRASVDRRSAWRTPALATVEKGAGLPRVRTVVLRRVDVSARQLWIHTDRRSNKWRDLAECGRAELMFWDPKPQRQLRLACHIEPCPNGGEAWATMSPAARRTYGIAPGPGAPIPHAKAYYFEQHSAEAQFGVLLCSALSADLLELHPDGHRRARQGYEGEGLASWVAP